MGYVHFHETGYLTDKDGEAMYLVGINYSPRGTHGSFWKETWEPEGLLRDLDRIQELGLNGIRFPVHWYAFEPKEGEMDDLMLERLDWFIAMCRERGLYMQPWFLVGCANGMFDVPWRDGRSFVYDESMIQAEERHLAVFAQRYREEEYILAWDICDEPEWFSRIAGQENPLPYDRGKFAAWTRRMYHALKDQDPNHLVTMGVGHIITGAYGMDIRDMADTVDVMAITCYYGAHGIDKARSGFEYDWNADMNRFSRSVYLCEAPGQTSCEHFDEELCGHYESVIYGTWLHGSVGTMPWQFCGCPRELWTMTNMDEYMNPAGYGIVDGEGSLKPQGETLGRIARSMKKIGAAQFRLRSPKAALLIPEGYHTHVRQCYPQLRDTYAALVAADVPVETVWISDAYERYPFLIVSATHSSPVIPLMVGDSYRESVGYLKNSEFLRLKRYVENGGNLLFLDRTQVASPVFEELFGATFGSVTGLWEDRQMTFAEDLGGFRAGEDMELGEGIGSYRRLAPGEARALATVDGGWPLVIQNRLGKGQVIYLAADIFSDFYKMSPSAWDSSPLPSLMGALMERLGAERPVVCGDVNVECGILEHVREDVRLAVIFNRNDTDSTSPVVVKHMAAYRAETEDGEPVPCTVDGEDMVLAGPFAARRATLVILRRR